MNAALNSIGILIAVVGTAVIMAALGYLGYLAVRGTRRQLKRWNP